MKNMIYIKHTLAALAIAGAANVACAQDDLSKEITVETDYKPTEQKASKLNRLPAVSKATQKSTTLKYSDWAVPSEVPTLAPLMMPYGYQTTHAFSTKRGYFDLSAGSLLNITGSLGYQIIDKENMSLNAWYQHNSTWAGRNKSEALNAILDETLKQKYNNNLVGVDFSNRFYQGTLTASLQYHYDRFNYYGLYNKDNTTGTYNIAGLDDSDKMQTVSEFQAKIGWGNNRNDDALQYSAKLMFNHFGFKKMSPLNDINGRNQNHVNLSLSGESAHNNAFRIGANADLHYLNTSHGGDVEGAPSSERSHQGLVKLAPYLRYENGNFNALVGINADITMGEGSGFRLSPNVKLDYTITDGFAVYAQAKGGRWMNTLHGMYSANRYFAPANDFTTSYSPLDAEGGFKIGPFSGFHAKLFAGYGIFKYMNMPEVYYSETTDGYMSPTNAMTTYTCTDFKGYKLGFELGYKFRSIAEAKVNLTYAPQDAVDKGYFTGYDRAKVVAAASVTVTPIEKLKIGIDYQLRCKRYAFCNQGYISTMHEYAPVNLGDVSNLSLGASYQITDMISIFAQGNNLLNKRWDNYFCLGTQPLNVLGGVSIVF